MVWIRLKFGVWVEVDGGEVEGVDMGSKKLGKVCVPSFEPWCISSNSLGKTVEPCTSGWFIPLALAGCACVRIELIRGAR